MDIGFWQGMALILISIIILYIIIPSFLHVCAKDFVRGWLKGYHQHRKETGGTNGEEKQEKR